ncbi:hypothetical protein BKA70DRAFT_1410148 [Coprinopsis sp. MPI-PUGE-AT-0042]|nr:hypothetical protein BKA70DRAFT_1410148 [Coprinopsis sp. MPI-PUGE-AT-0042]
MAGRSRGYIVQESHHDRVHQTEKGLAFGPLNTLLRPPFSYQPTVMPLFPLPHPCTIRCVSWSPPESQMPSNTPPSRTSAFWLSHPDVVLCHGRDGQAGCGTRDTTASTTSPAPLALSSTTRTHGSSTQPMLTSPFLNPSQRCTTASLRFLSLIRGGVNRLQAPIISEFIHSIKHYCPSDSSLANQRSHLSPLVHATNASALSRASTNSPNTAPKIDIENHPSFRDESKIGWTKTITRVAYATGPSSTIAGHLDKYLNWAAEGRSGGKNQGRRRKPIVHRNAPDSPSSTTTAKNQSTTKNLALCSNQVNDSTPELLSLLQLQESRTATITPSLSASEPRKKRISRFASVSSKRRFSDEQRGIGPSLLVNLLILGRSRNTKRPTTLHFSGGGGLLLAPTSLFVLMLAESSGVLTAMEHHPFFERHWTCDEAKCRPSQSACSSKPFTVEYLSRTRRSVLRSSEGPAHPFFNFCHHLANRAKAAAQPRPSFDDCQLVSARFAGSCLSWQALAMDRNSTEPSKL